MPTFSRVNKPRTKTCHTSITMALTLISLVCRSTLVPDSYFSHTACPFLIANFSIILAVFLASVTDRLNSLIASISVRQ